MEIFKMHFFEEGKISPYLYLNTGGKMFHGSISALIQDNHFNKILLDKMKDNLTVKLKHARTKSFNNEIESESYDRSKEDFSIFIECTEMIALLSIIISFCGKTKYIGSKAKDAVKGDKAVISLKAKINEIKEISLIGPSFFPQDTFEYYDLLKSLERITVFTQHDSLFDKVSALNERISFINDESNKLKNSLARILDDSYKLKDFSIASYSTVLLNEHLKKYEALSASFGLSYLGLIEEAKRYFPNPGSLDMKKLDDLAKIELKKCEYEECNGPCECEVISKTYYLNQQGQLAHEYVLKNCFLPKCKGCGGERLLNQNEDGTFEFDQPPPFCRSSFYEKGEDWLLDLKTERRKVTNNLDSFLTRVRFVPYAYWHHEYPVLK